MEKSSSSGMGFLAFLGLLFIALKLMGYITWPWIWVLTSFWAPFGVFCLSWDLS